MKKILIFLLTISLLMLSILGLACAPQDTNENDDDWTEQTMTYPQDPKFVDFDKLLGKSYFECQEMSAHDPSIFQDEDGTFYVFSTHGLGARQVQIRKSEDLIHWQTLPCAIDSSELQEGKTYAGQPNTDVWAPDVIKGADGKYWLYYSMSRWGSSRSYIGLAKSDKVTGPYYHDSMVLTSSGGGGPNAIDPNVIKDPKTQKLYMVYGSFFGGIYIKELDAATGRAKDQDFGKKLVGGSGMAIEGPYIVYNREHDNYYLFVSYGSLSSDYNIRVARSAKIDGDYIDADGNLLGMMTHLNQNYGTKILGGYAFTNDPKNELNLGWMAPGHNSVIKANKDWFLAHHVRTYRYGEGPHIMHIRKMVFNEDGWPAVSPFRYAGQANNKYSLENLAGDYQLIFQGKDTVKEPKTAISVRLNQDGAVTGEITGTFSVWEDGKLSITIQQTCYKGFVEAAWNNDQKRNTLAVSLIGGGESILGRRV